MRPRLRGNGGNGDPIAYRPGDAPFTGSSRRGFACALAVLAVTGAQPVQAQFGRRQRGDSPAGRAGGRDTDTAHAAHAPADPAESIARELPSLRVDLALSPDQRAAFDGFERAMRDVADIARDQRRHAEGFRHDDGSLLAAATVLSTLADDDASRADASRGALERLRAFTATLDADQRKKLDQRVIEALREPLGAG